MFKYHYLNGQFVEEKEAVIPIQDIGITRGYGIFDYFQICQGAPICMDWHIDRFLNSCAKMRLEINMNKAQLKSIIHQSIKINNMSDAGIKLIVTGGKSPNGFDVSSPNIAILALPYVMVSTEISTAGTYLVSHKYTRPLADIKTTNYSMAIFLSPGVKAKEAIEPLYYSDKSVTECSRSNIFGIKDKTIFTPDEDILMGISRRRVLDLAEKNEYEVILGPIRLKELKQMDEVFLTGTTKKVLPVVKIDDDIIGPGIPGPSTRKIQKLFNAQEEEIIQTYHNRLF